MKIETPVMNSWLLQVVKSDNTRYREHIQRFLDFCNCTLEDIAEEWDSVGTYAQEKRFKKKWNRKVKDFRAFLNTDSSIVEGTRETYMVPVASFFKKYLDSPVKVKVNHPPVTYHNRDIKREEIDVIIKNTPHIRDASFYSFMKDSGLRPCVLKQLQYEDMKEDWQNNVVPCKINVPQHKNKGQYKKHYTFIGQETVELLRAYWDLRFGINVNPKDNDLVFSQSKTENVPISPDSESSIFGRIVVKLNIVEREENKESLKFGKPRPVRLYNLRKFFRNNLGIDSTDIHFFMGHMLDKNDEHYFSAQNIEKFRAKYAKAYEHLKVSTVPNSYKEQVKYLTAKLTQTEMELKNMQKNVREIIQEEMQKLVQTDPQTTHMVEDFIRTHYNVKPERVSYTVTISENNNAKIISVLGYWRNAKYVKLESPATITTK